MRRPVLQFVGLALLGAAVLSAPGAAGARGLIGALYVTTRPPGAAVYVNGELKGVSPCGIPDVGVGEVELRAERQGYADAVQTVEVEADRTVQVDLQLAPLASVGSIAVLVEPPGSKVELDHVPRGRTPLVILNVRAGTHGLVVSAQDHHPLHSTVNVARNEQFVLRGRLTPTQAAAASGAAPADLETLGELDPRDVLPTDQLAEEAAFEPVRTLTAQRQYEEALEALAEMTRDPRTAEHAYRIGLQRRLTRRMQEVLEAGREGLRAAVGQQYVLRLGSGIRFEGRIVEVGETQMRVETGGGERDIALEAISADQIVRLAAARLDPSDPDNMLSFAALYAAEGDFERAYEQLRAAAEAGAGISSVRSYVDSERLWAAAVAKEQAERLRARLSGRPPHLILSGEAPPLRLLIDTYRGGDLPPELKRALQANGFEPVELSGPFGGDEARGAGLLAVRDAGPGRPVPAYDQQELQAIVDFLQRGGGLVFFGSARPAGGGRPTASPFDPLLSWFGVQVRPDVLSVSDEAPGGFPEAEAICFPVAGHPLGYGVGHVVLPLSSPSLGVGDAGWAFLQTHPLVGSKLTGEAAPVVGAARALGAGRVVVFANLPALRTSPSERSPFYANDAEAALLHAFMWASHPARLRQRVGEPGPATPDQ